MAWQLIAIATATVLLWAVTSVTPALIATWALAAKALLRAWSARCAFAATFSLAFKTRFALRAIAA